MLNPGDLLAWDVDDVLLPFTDPFLVKYTNAALGTSLTIDDFHDPYVSIVVPHLCDKETEFAIVDAIYASDEYHDAEPLEGVLQALELLPHLRHVAMTARTPAIKLQTHASFERCFLGRFENIHFMSKLGREDYLGTKPELAQKLGAKGLVDDTPHNLNTCAERGIQGFLLSKPHNLSAPESTDYIRVPTVLDLAHMLVPQAA